MFERAAFDISSDLKVSATLGSPDSYLDERTITSCVEGTNEVSFGSPHLWADQSVGHVRSFRVATGLVVPDRLCEGMQFVMPERSCCDDGWAAC